MPGLVGTGWLLAAVAIGVSVHGPVAAACAVFKVGSLTRYENETMKSINCEYMRFMKEVTGCNHDGLLIEGP